MNTDIILQELRFKAVRSSGAGGQHVNKTSSKVEVHFNVLASEGLSAQEKELLQDRISNKVNKEGVLTLQCSESRSQHRNKRLVIERLVGLLKANLRTRKPRRKSRPTKSAIEKRLKSKKQQSLKKSNRRRPSLD